MLKVHTGKQPDMLKVHTGETQPDMLKVHTGETARHVKSAYR